MHTNFLPLDSDNCSSLCKNNGTCKVSPSDGLSCDCTGTGYIGARCECKFSDTLNHLQGTDIPY